MSISVIIPCYRAAATLRRAVDSALTGAPADLEVLLVDDGSPDDTGALCDELAAADPRVRALHRANGGAGAARNTGLDAAHGDWVLFLDADDALLPGLWAALDALTTDADMILFGLTRESSGAVKPTDYLPAGFCPDLQALGSALSPLLFDTGLLAAPYPKLFRRAAIGTVRFDARLAINEDVLFNIQFLQNTSAIYCLDGVYYKQYDTEAGSLSRRLRGDLLDAERVTRPALADLLRQNGIDPAPYEAASRLRMELDSMPVEIDATTRQLTQLQIEEQALMKETDDASKERLEALRQEIAEVQEKLNVQKAGWLNQKNAIDHVQELKGQLDEAKSEEERATRNGDLGRASELRYSVIPGLQQQIQDSEAALEAQKQQDGEGLNEQVTSDEIAEVVSAWTGVPVSKMMQGELDKLKGLEGELHKRVIGQDEAVSAVAAAVRRSRAGLSDPDKPIGSFFFLGPTGVGKTELAKALAECLFDDERALVRIDMSEYMEKFSVQRLIGAPPGYVGYDEGGQLTEAVRRRPYSVILLDEMEKAHPDVFNVLLQVLDDGRLTDGQGRQVSFKNTIIIMTSNVGSKAIAELSGKDEEEMRHQVDAAMAQTFRPEFLNRIDDIVVFHPLGMAQIEKIVDIQLADVRARLAKERMTLAITPAAKQMLAVGGLDPVFGARPLKRLVQREVVDAIAAAIIDGTVREGDQVTVDVDKDGGFTVVCDNTPAATYEVPDAE